MNKDYIELLQDENTGEFYEPYATIVCKTEEDFKNMQEALEKQIGKKPLHSIYYPNGRKHHHTYCGKCGMYSQRVYLNDNYCRNCGTKIDWSEADE